MSSSIPATLSVADRMHFVENGYVIVRNVASATTINRMLEVTRRGLADFIEPVEYESQLQYPGAPSQDNPIGAKTIRRLKQAHSRDIIFTEWITNLFLVSSLQQLLGNEIVCPLAHHNCVMTKEPQFSSDTGWHQDIRYWSFARPDLVSVWLALGKETTQNGCLQLVPGSHRLTFGQHQFDEELFFRDDLHENQQLLEQKIYAELNPGDVLFFHCRTLHAATRNFTDQTKFAAVFTFRSTDNPPIAHTRSANCPELLIHSSVCD